MQVLHLISGRGRWDVAALAEELECSTRTIHRLLQTLSMAGVPWFFDEKIRAYKIREGYKFPLIDTKDVGLPNSIRASPELSEIAKQLLTDGEAFARTLNQFLTVLREGASEN